MYSPSPRGASSSAVHNPSSPTSAKHLAVSRRVSRIMDFDANEAMIEVLVHTEKACPELIRASPHTHRATAVDPDSSDEEGGDYSAVVAGDYAALTGHPQFTSPSPPPSPHQGADAAQFAVRRPLEGCVTSLHEEFLAKLREVRDHYRSVRSEVQELEKDAAELKSRAEVAVRKVDPLIAAVAVRREELREVRNRQGQLNSLLREYRISDDETLVLESGVVDGLFLDTVDKVKRIHHSCRNLMLGTHQHAVVDVAESMYMTRLKATEIICQHLCTHLTPILSLPPTGPSSASAPALPPLLLRCLLSINDRPSHFGRVVGDIVSARRSVLTAKYRELLYGVPGGQVRDAHPHKKGSPVPLETYATTDPLRFTTELLSWLHQRAAEEDDLLQQFYPPDPSGDNSGGTTDGGSPLARRSEAVGDILDPLAQPIRVRLEQLAMVVAKQAEAALGPRGGGGDTTSVVAPAPPSRGFSYGGAFSAAASLLFGGMGGSRGQQGGSSPGGPLWSAGAINGIVSLFQIDSILAYYCDTYITPLAGPASGIVEGLSSAKLNCLMLSYNVLRVAVDSVSDSRTAASMVAAALPRTPIDAQAIRGRWTHPAGTPPPTSPPSSEMLVAALHELQYPGCDLAPPPGVDSLAQVVRGALEVVQGNRLLRTSEEKEREATPILGAAIDAIVAMVAPISRDPAVLDLLPPSIQVCELVKCVLRINICSKFKALLVPYPFAIRRTQQLSDEISQDLTMFEHIGGVCVEAKLGLGRIADGLKSAKPPSSPGGAVDEALTQDTIASIRLLHGMLQDMRRGDVSRGEGNWLGPLTSCITSSQLREQAGGRVNACVVHHYSDVAKYLKAMPESSSPILAAAVALVGSYPPDQVAVLLGSSVDL